MTVELVQGVLLCYCWFVDLDETVLRGRGCIDGMFSCIYFIQIDWVGITLVCVFNCE